MRDNCEREGLAGRGKRCESVKDQVQMPTYKAETSARLRIEYVGNALCYGRPITRDGTRVHNECDGFRAGQMLLELVANARVPRNVDDSQGLMA